MPKARSFEEVLVVVKVVCAETNKKFDVMSTALENEDRDFVTEDDLRAGNELVWVKNNNRLTVRVARAEAGRPTILRTSYT